MESKPIPVLMYHKVTPRREAGVTTLHPKKFAKQMKWLYENGYKTVSSTAEYDEKSIIITFDDAYENIYDIAFPILKSFGFTAIVFPVVEYIGRYNSWDANLLGVKFKHMSWDHLNSLVKNGWEIGGHTDSHNIQSIIRNVQKEIIDSKRKIENKLSIKINSFSFPFGYINDALKKCVERNFECAFSASVQKKDATYYRSRIPIYSFDTLSSFKRKLKFNKLDIKISNMIHQASYATMIYQKIKL